MINFGEYDLSIVAPANDAVKKPCWSSIGRVYNGNVQNLLGQTEEDFVLEELEVFAL